MLEISENTMGFGMMTSPGKAEINIYLLHIYRADYYGY